MTPPISPTFAAVILMEILFGFGFNRLAHWGQDKGLWHVSLSVVMGVTGTLAIPTAAWWRESFPVWIAALVTVACFAGSGLPMIIGSMHRSVAKSHKRKGLPNTAARIRDEVVLDLHVLADRLVLKAKSNELKSGDLAECIHQVHQLIGQLRSM